MKMLVLNQVIRKIQDRQITHDREIDLQVYVP